MAVEHLNDKVCFEGIEVDFSTNRIIRDGEVRAIEPKVMQVLRVLIENRGQPVAHVDIKARVWKNEHGHDQGVTRAIHILRHALGDEKSPRKYIETISKKGYRFIATLSCAPEDSQISLVSPTDKQTAEVDERQSERTSRKTIFNWVVFAAAIVAVTFIGTATILLTPTRTHNDEDAEGSTSAEVDRRVIRSALDVLLDNNWPIDRAVDAMVRTKNFDDALELLKQNYQENQSSYTISESIEVVHQIGAMAFYPDPETALRAYKELYAIDSGDWLAAYQLARLHHSRGESAEARRYINEALKADYAGTENLLSMQLTKERITSTDPAETAHALYNLANRALEDGFEDVWADAVVYAIDSEWRAATSKQPRDYSALQERLELLRRAIDYQLDNDLDHRAAVSLAILGNIQYALTMLPQAEDTNRKALAIEEIIRRPRQLHTIYSNLALCNFRLEDYEEAEAFNQKAIGVLREAGLFGDLAFNMMVAAHIAKQTGKEKQVCNQIRKAIKGFDPKFNAQEALQQMQHELGCT